MKHITHKEFDEEISKAMEPQDVTPDNRNMRKELLDKANQFKQVKNG